MAGKTLTDTNPRAVAETVIAVPVAVETAAICRHDGGDGGDVRRSSEKIYSFRDVGGVVGNELSGWRIRDS